MDYPHLVHYWELFRLSVGAFLTSAGFGGTAALVAGYLAFRGIQSRIRFDGDLAKETEARKRWWEALMWLWENHTKISPQGITTACDSLSVLADTEEQSVMLGVVQKAIFTPQPTTTTPPGG